MPAGRDARCDMTTERAFHARCDLRDRRAEDGITDAQRVAMQVGGSGRVVLGAASACSQPGPLAGRTALELL